MAQDHCHQIEGFRFQQPKSGAPFFDGCNVYSGAM